MELERDILIDRCVEWDASKKCLEWLHEQDDIVFSDALPDSSWTSWYLVNAGIRLSDVQYDNEILELLLTHGTPAHLFFACKYWKDKRFDRRLCTALAATRNPQLLYYSGKDLQERYEPCLGDALAKTCSVEQLYEAGCDWPPGLYTDSMRTGFIGLRSAEYLYKAGRYWRSSRFCDGIRDALIATGDAFFIYQAGFGWGKERYHSDILNALFDLRDRKFLPMAKRIWPKYRNIDWKSYESRIFFGKWD